MNKSKARLFHLTGEQDRLVHGLRNEIIDNGGYISFSQLFRDAVNLMLQKHRDEIIQRYSPIIVENFEGEHNGF